MTSTAALIFSAGKGTRLRPLTERTPKPLLEVKEGKSLIDLTLESLIAVGITDIFINISYGEELFKEKIGKYQDRCKIVILPKEEEPLGQGGTILSNLKTLNTFDTILCSNGDTFAKYDRLSFLKSHSRSSSSLTILSDNTQKLPRDIISNIKRVIIGCRLNSKDYYYNEPLLKLINRNNYLGEFAFNPKDIRDQEYSVEFRGLFGSDDLIEILLSNNKQAKVYTNKAEYFLSMNTIEEYESVRKFLEQM